MLHGQKVSVDLSCPVHSPSPAPLKSKETPTPLPAAIAARPTSAAPKPSPYEPAKINGGPIVVKRPVSVNRNTPRYVIEQPETRCQ